MKRKVSAKKVIYSLIMMLSLILSPCMWGNFAKGSEDDISTYENQQASFSESDEYVSEQKKDAAISSSSIRIEDFTDINNQAWYYNYVKNLVDKGVVKGVSRNSFSPNGTFTVAECAAIITRYLNLEDYAGTLSRKLASLNLPGSGKWYAGYMQLMYEAEIMDTDQFGISVNSDGCIEINHPELIERPVLRYEFAAYITRSFELDNTMIRANNTYHEIGGLAHEFISGGAYDEDSLNAYQKEISDFESIPKDYSEYVLKAYYNGIFNGDDAGKFNPNQNLTRAEMTKVVSVIISPSLRVRNEYRALPKAFEISEGDYVTNTAGQKVLKRERGFEILTYMSNHIKASLSDGKLNVTYTQFNSVPYGYYIEASINRQEGSSYVREAHFGAMTEGSQKSPYQLSASFKATGATVLLILRSAENKGEVAGFLLADIAPDGSIGINHCFSAMAQ